MNLASIRLDALADGTLEIVHAFCRALLREPESLRELVTNDFTWLGQTVGWDPDRLARLVGWMQSGGAAYQNPRVLSASVMSSIPTWASEQAFGGLKEGERVAFVDLLHQRDRATIALLLATRGPMRGRVHHAIDPASFARIVRLGQALAHDIRRP